MSVADRRLEKLEQTLTPKQAVLQWMAEAHAYGSLRAHVDSLQGAPDEAYPLVRLGRQMEATVKAELRGSRKTDSEVWQSVRMAVRDAGFLYYLISQVNYRAIEERRANWLHIALVVTMVRTLFEPESAHERAFWREQAVDLAHRLFLQQQTAEAIARHYLDGNTPLYPEVAADVAAQAADIERIVRGFNEAVQLLTPAKRRRKTGVPEQPRAEPIDLERVRREAQAAVPEQMALLVDLAKAHG